MMLPGQQQPHTDNHMIDQFTEHYLATDHLAVALMRTYISESLLVASVAVLTCTWVLRYT